MNVRELQYVLTIAEERNITRAAERLRITQPSLSKFLSALEKKQGYCIFDRSVSPLQLTEEGRLYIEAARSIVAVADRLNRQIAELHDLKGGTLRVGLGVTRAFYFLPDILPCFARCYPDVHLSVTESPSFQLEEKLASGQLDLVIVDGMPLLPGFEVKKLYREQFYLATPPGMFDARQSADEILRSLKGGKAPFVLLSEGQRSRELARRVFCDYSLEPDIVQETHVVDTAIKLCAQGIGMTFVSDMVKRRMNFRVVPDYYELGERYVNEVCALWRSGGWLPRAAMPFIELFERFSQQ